MDRTNPLDPSAINVDDAVRDLDALVRRALEGAPQVIVDREGREVVLVSAEAWRARTESLRDFLTKGGRGPDNDPLDDLID